METVGQSVTKSFESNEKCLKEAKTEDKNVEHEMSYVHLYHNNGFNTRISKFNDLKGRKFIWKSHYNISKEEAGYLYVQQK